MWVHHSALVAPLSLCTRPVPRESSCASHMTRHWPACTHLQEGQYSLADPTTLCAITEARSRGFEVRPGHSARACCWPPFSERRHAGSVQGRLEACCCVAPVPVSKPCWLHASSLLLLLVLLLQRCRRCCRPSVARPEPEPLMRRALPASRCRPLTPMRRTTTRRRPSLSQKCTACTVGDAGIPWLFAVGSWAGLRNVGCRLLCLLCSPNSIFVAVQPTACCRSFPIWCPLHLANSTAPPASSPPRPQAPCTATGLAT